MKHLWRNHPKGSTQAAAEKRSSRTVEVAKRRVKPEGQDEGRKQTSPRHEPADAEYRMSSDSSGVEDPERRRVASEVSHHNQPKQTARINLLKPKEKMNVWYPQTLRLIQVA